MHFSVVVPLYNEAPNVERLLREVTASLDRNPHVDAYELICVDDGSTDSTRELLERHRTPPTRIVSLSANRGQSAALAAGIAAARHDVIGRIDGDLQTTPDDFEILLAKLGEGYDCAHGMRVDRRDPPVRRWSSRLANAVRRGVLGDRFRDISCPLTVFRRECLAAIPPLDALHRYLPYLIQMQGYRVAEVPVRHFPRRAGTTKYGIRNRLWVGIRSLRDVRRLAKAHAARRQAGTAP